MMNFRLWVPPLLAGILALAGCQSWPLPTITTAPRRQNQWKFGLPCKLANKRFPVVNLSPPWELPKAQPR